MSANLRRAVAKVKHHDGRQWVACVTPAEALALIDAGAVPALAMYSREAWDAWRSRGVSGLSWFYFTIRANSKLATSIGGAQ